MIITPKNWLGFQHYKNRRPPWIKLYRSLLDDSEWHCLPDASKALAIMLWLLASESESGEINADSKPLAFRLRTTPQKIKDALNPLIESGFFVASTMLSNRLQDAIPERETEGETETETSLVVAKADNVPFGKIVDLYHQALPVLPRVADLSAKRKALVRARWQGIKPESVDDGLNEFKCFFDIVSKSKFLTGQSTNGGGRPFRANFEWLMNESNYLKVIEGNYHA